MDATGFPCLHPGCDNRTDGRTSTRCPDHAPEHARTLAAHAAEVAAIRELTKRMTEQED